MKTDGCKVKICGITNLEDAIQAVEAGADMLGFNFYPPSPRFISPDACREIIAALEGQNLSAVYIGVFVNASSKEIARTLNRCGLDLAQLSGDEPPEFLLDLKEKAFKGLRPKSLNEGIELAQEYAKGKAIPALLVDAHQAGAYGGTGRLANWEIARVIAERYPILLAGGLHPTNVASALDEVRPWGVDVASGVEAKPGKKDHRLVRDFIRAVKNNNQEVTL
jgi:phosphoribosylanthranilate isomerase